MFNRRHTLSLGAAAAITGLVAPSSFARDAERKTLNDKLTGNLSPVHDPSAIRQDDTFHVFPRPRSARRPA